MKVSVAAAEFKRFLAPFVQVITRRKGVLHDGIRIVADKDTQTITVWGTSNRIGNIHLRGKTSARVAESGEAVYAFRDLDRILRKPKGDLELKDGEITNEGFTFQPRTGDLLPAPVGVYEQVADIPREEGLTILGNAHEFTYDPKSYPDHMPLGVRFKASGNTLVAEATNGVVAYRCPLSSGKFTIHGPFNWLIHRDVVHLVTSRLTGDWEIGRLQSEQVYAVIGDGVYTLYFIPEDLDGRIYPDLTRVIPSAAASLRVTACTASLTSALNTLAGYTSTLRLIGDGTALVLEDAEQQFVRTEIPYSGDPIEYGLDPELLQVCMKTRDEEFTTLYFHAAFSSAKPALIGGEGSPRVALIAPQALP